MELTITLSDRSAAKLAEVAASNGRTPTAYVSDLIERSLESNGNGLVNSDAERQRLGEALARRLKEAADLAPTLTGPVIEDFDRTLDDAMQQEARKQGLDL